MNTKVPVVQVTPVLFLSHVLYLLYIADKYIAALLHTL